MALQLDLQRGRSSSDSTSEVHIHLLPVDDVPEGCHVLRPPVLVLKVVGMLRGGKARQISLHLPARTKLKLYPFQRTSHTSRPRMGIILSSAMGIRVLSCKHKATGDKMIGTVQKQEHVMSPHREGADIITQYQTGHAWLGVEVIPRVPSALTPSHAHPEPKRVAAAVLNFAFSSSIDPKEESMAACKLQEGHTSSGRQ